jgi:hypothetical protein
MATKTKKRTAKRTAKQSPFGKSKKDDEFAFDIPDDADSGTRGARIPEGEYRGKCVSIIKDKSKAGNPMYVWSFVITKGRQAGRDFPLYTVLTPEAMWKLSETLLALGVPAEAGTSGVFQKSDVIGVYCVLVIEDDEFENRPRSKLTRILPDPRGAGRRSKVAGQFPPEEEPEDEEEEEDEYEEEEEDEEEEYEDEDEEEEEEWPDEDEDDWEDDENEEEEEEEEEEPAPKRSTRKRVNKKPTPKKKTSPRRTTKKTTKKASRGRAKARI